MLALLRTLYKYGDGTSTQSNPGDISRQGGLECRQDGDMDSCLGTRLSNEECYHSDSIEVTAYYLIIEGAYCPSVGQGISLVFAYIQYIQEA
jgi:hypothetical protein